MSEKISCSVRIDQELYDRLVHTAARHHITVEQFIAAALKAGIIANEIFENDTSVIHIMNKIGHSNGSD